MSPCADETRLRRHAGTRGEPHARQFVFTKPQSSRAKEAIDLQKLAPGSHVEPTVAGAISYARQSAPAGTTVLICGSLYLIGEARSILMA